MTLISEQLKVTQLLENLPAGVVVHEMDTTITYANKVALKLLRMDEKQVLGKQALTKEWALINESGKALEIEEYPVNRVIQTKQPIHELIIGIVDAENTKPTWVVVNAYLDDSYQHPKVVVTFTDITQSNELPFREIVDNAKDAVIITDAGNIDAPLGPKIVYVNDMFCKISGYTREEVMGKTPRVLQGEKTDRLALDNIRRGLDKQEPVREMIYNYSKAGKPYWLDISIFPLHMHGNKKATHFAAIERDISDIKRTEQEYQDASRTDPLTGLLNRRGFETLSRKRLECKSGEHRLYSIIAIDIDHFKKINDNYGHACGDKVLQSMGQTIKATFRENDLCARFGGEEFIIMLPDQDTDLAEKIAQRLRLRIQEQVLNIDSQRVQFTISAGITSGMQFSDIQPSLDNADKALYEAKRLGRNRVEIFAQAKARLDLNT